MSCEYCNGENRNNKVIGNFKTDIGKIELFLEASENNEIQINSYETSKYNLDLSVNGSIKINYCPMCGEKIIRRFTPKQAAEELTRLLGEKVEIVGCGTCQK